MRVLVLGGAGFIGSRIVRRLVDQGHEVMVVDDMSTGSPDNLLDLPHVKVYQEDATASCDIFDSGTLDAVFHFASPASPDVFVSQWGDVVRANIGGAMTAASLLRKGGLLVLASSSEVYGQPSVMEGMREETLGSVRTQSVRGVYDESKRLAEAIVYSACQREQIRGLVLRIFNTYGPGMPDDGRVINTFVRQARAGEPLTVHGDGTQTRSFCYVDDTVDQIMALVDWAEIGLATDGECQVFNVGNPVQSTILGAAHAVAAACDRICQFTLVHSPRPDDPVWRIPVMNKTYRAIGERVMTSLSEGVRRCF